VLEDAAVRLPRLAAVVGAEEDAGVRSEVEGVGFLRPAGLKLRTDIPVWWRLAA